MTFNEYQSLAAITDTRENDDLVYPTLGLAGEAGEVAEKIKKLWRNKGVTTGKLVDELDRQELKKELGDCLWYLAAIARKLDISLVDVAETNIAKTHDRLKRGVIKSEGDNR
jgi:NTP pyrophosphatase (non-canonical NTP hydrolase)